MKYFGFKKNTNKAFKHKCKRCEPLKTTFTPTKQILGSTVELIGGRKYEIHYTGAWIRIN